LSGADVNEEHVKLMRNRSGLIAMFKETSQTPKADHIPVDQYKSTSPSAS